ncbi:MAG: histidinol-phosphatase [bacterium]|nr:histidinol-phosphatase [bacterium]
MRRRRRRRREEEEDIMDIFKNGSTWLKADFHLHTKADKEFKYTGEENDFVRAYIEQLKNNDIGIGIIANHNKFNPDEYNALRRAGLKENIFLIPGIELSINDGSNGIHCLIAFEYTTWVNQGSNFVEQFLNSAFEGVSNRENANTRCNYNLSDLFKKLEEHRKNGRDFFIIMAHVEQDNGFCKELNGGRIKQLANDKNFRRNVLAFQKVRTADLIDNLNIWFGSADSVPVFVEGSDCKKIDDVGKPGTQTDENGRSIEKKCFLKIGDFNFEAVKYALSDKKNRLKPEKPKISNSFVKSITFEGSHLDGKEINLSAELNNFIGIRGSGKSAILEILRDTLGIPLGNQAIDRDYKNGLIDYVLKSGSGSKVKVTIINEHKEEYRIEKIYGQKEDIFKEGIRKDITIDAIFKRPVYFGQKDLSNKNIDFEADLVDKLTGNKLEDIRARIGAKGSEIEDVIDRLKKLENLEELKKETIERLKNAEHKLELFEKEGVKEKLRLQSRFDLDITRLEESQKGITGFLKDLESLIENHFAFWEDINLKSDDNKDIFEEANKILSKLKEEYLKLSEIRNNTNRYSVDFENIIIKLKEKKDGLKEEFAKIKREINIPDLNPDEFLKLNRQIEISKLKLREIEKSEDKRIEYLTTLNDKIFELDNLWHEEFKILEKEVQRIDQVENQLSISIEYKGRRDKFLDKIKQVFKGSRITETNYIKIKDEYKDFIQIYRNKEPLKNILNETHLAEFNKRFSENLAELLTYQVKDKVTIKYNNKPLNDHSLGQRATALILFLLAQKETDVLIIDQPEDDMDNQTIYKDVIKEIKSLKGNMQFIFATHNANIPVLGDSEKVIACDYTEEKFEIHTGTIDCRDTQKRIIDIMEGGDEAFDRRRNIYDLWRK